MSKDKQPLTESTQPFSILLARIESGALHAELTDQQRELFGELAVRAAQDGKAKGSLTLTLNFTFERGGVVEVVGDVKMKAPKATREKSIFWVTPGNNLSVDNPRQPDLPLRAVTGSEETPREIPAEQVPARKL